MVNLCGLLFALVVAAAIVGAMNRKPSEAPRGAPGPQIAAATPPPAPAVRSPQIGDTGFLGYPGGGGHAVWLCLEESSWNDLLDAQNARSLAAVSKLARAGKVRAYPVGTRVRVAHASFASRKVIVLDGDDRGDIGWVQSEFVLAQKPDPARPE